MGDAVNTNDGEVMVFSYIDSNHVQVVFIETLTVATFTAANLRSGKVKDYAHPSIFGVGFVGIGKHHTHIDSQITNVGLIWRNALKRCYSPNTQASYEGTTVAPEFHNFQTFSSWHEQQENKHLAGLQLDKDLLPFMRGEQSEPQYSERNCCLIPASINLKLSKLQKRLAQLAKARAVHPVHAVHAVLPVGMNFDTCHLNFRVSVNGELVGTKTRLGAALNLYGKANIQVFIEEVELHKEALSSEVLAEFYAYKQRIEAHFQPRIKAPEAEMTTV